MTYPKFFKKAIKGSVGGRLLNKRDQEEEFLLKGDPTSPTADPDRMIVEIPNEESEKFFKKNNKAAIVNGYLIEVSDYESELDPVNAVTDGELKDILKKPLAKIKRDIKKFTSPVPLYRLLDLAKEADKSVKTVKAIEDAINNLEGQTVVESTSTENTVVRNM